MNTEQVSLHKLQMLLNNRQQVTHFHKSDVRKGQITALISLQFPENLGSRGEN